MPPREQSGEAAPLNTIWERPESAVSMSEERLSFSDEAPPVVTRAFLFTDIEGSTRLWEKHPVAMRRALAQHDALLFAITEKRAGHVFKTLGDAFCIAFESPENAVYAAIDAQLALQAQNWGQVEPIRVRMAIHWGDAEARDNDYFGTPLNRGARLRDAGHGGQILISAVVWEALTSPETALSELIAADEITFSDQGQHRLKDISETEHVYQVCAPGLPIEFPKLRTPSTHPNNLPAATTTFIGRRAEARAVRDLLTQPGVRLLTLSGMGGTGKTRLALDVASDLLEMYPQGVWFADLAAVASPALVLPTLLRTCGLKPSPSQTPLDQLSQHFRDAHALLVLDTFEQVADAADDIAHLLRATNYLRILATARTLLELSMEYEFAVPPLRGSDCVALFEARARQVLPEFSVTDANQVDVEAICTRVDNLPLAVELAAAQMRSLPLPEIQRALESSMDVLSTRMRDLSPRQRSLRGAIDWSYSLLTPEARRLFRSLSVFVGGFTLEATREICAAEGGADSVAPLLDRLRTSSLLREEKIASGEGEETVEARYSLLESLRQYGAERLTEEEAESVRERILNAHTAFYCRLAALQDTHLRGKGQRQAHRILSSEIANIRAGMDHALENRAITTAALYVVAMRRFWERQGYLTEGLERTERVLKDYDSIENDTTRADLLFSAGALATENGKLDQALRLFEQSVALSRETHNLAAEARALNGLGTVAYYQGNMAQSDECYQRALAVKREIGDMPGVAASLNNLAIQALSRTDYSGALPLTEESVAITESLGDLTAAAGIYNSLGVIREGLSDLEGARTAFERADTLSRTLGIPRTQARALINLGNLSLTANSEHEASAFFEESLRIVRPLDDKRSIAAAILGLGRCALLAGDCAAALTHCRESLALYRDVDEKQGIASALIVLAETASAGAGTAFDARLLLTTANALRDETGTQSSPQEAERIRRLEEKIGEATETVPDLAASLLVAAQMTG